MMKTAATKVTTTALLLSFLAIDAAHAAAVRAGQTDDHDDGAAGAQRQRVFRPARISFEDLLTTLPSDDDAPTSSISDSLMDALATTGMIAVTNVPGIDHGDNMMFQNLHRCMDSNSNSETTTTTVQVQEHVMDDGSVRRTLATKTIPNGVQPTIPRHESSSSLLVSQDCKSFERAAGKFRSSVATVTQAFADRLTEYLGEEKQEQEEEPVLKTEDGFAFQMFSDVVENGDHLEHFHSYQKLDSEGNGGDEKETIEMHTDQGLFIVFTPGRLLDHEQDAAAPSSELTSGFYIEQADGSAAEVVFDETDDLVIMLGDGVNQIPRLNDQQAKKKKKKLRAVPHALFMEPHDASQSRVWYGRMVLPPTDAVHPTHEITFGELRQNMIEASLHDYNDEDDAPSRHGSDAVAALYMGCSGGRVARDLSAITCEGDSIYCWHRCMNASYFEPKELVSPEICKSRNLEMLCINPRLQISDGDSHGDYYPACADPNTQEAVTPFPTLPEYPRLEETCAEEMFTSFVNETAYDHSYELPSGDATFLWSIEDDAVKGRLVYDGLFGYLAFGFSYVEGQPKDVHHAATMIMAVPGGNYSAYSGLDLTMDPTISEYVMPGKRPFRVWDTPVQSAVATTQSAVAATAASLEGFESYSVESNECFTGLTFKTDSIYNIKFNLTGMDELIWAANGVDYFMANHGKSAGRFAIHWPTGEVTPRKSKRSFGPAETTTSSSAAVVGLTGLIISVIALGTTVTMTIG